MDGWHSLRTWGAPVPPTVHYTTWRYLVTDFCAPPAEHVTVTGQLPGVVLVPTFQVHDATPEEFAFFGSRPAADEGPDLYSTTMLQLAPAKVLTVAVA